MKRRFGDQVVQSAFILFLTDLYLASGVYRWIAFETNLLGCPATDLNVQVCSSDAECDDGLFCNGSETCVAGLCQPTPAPDCDDGKGCTVDICNEDTDSCDNVPDADFCDDGEPCTEDLCDPQTGECVHTWPECGVEVMTAAVVRNAEWRIRIARAAMDTVPAPRTVRTAIPVPKIVTAVREAEPVTPASKVYATESATRSKKARNAQIVPRPTAAATESAKALKTA